MATRQLITTGIFHLSLRLQNITTMFGNLFGNLEEQQKAVTEKLATLKIDAEAGGGAVKVTVDGNQQVLNININKEALDWDDKEQVEDLVLEAINRALELSKDKAAEEAQNLVKDILPPGMDGLKDMFG